MGIFINEMIIIVGQSQKKNWNCLVVLGGGHFEMLEVSGRVC